MSLLQTKNLSINFGGLWAVNSVDLTVNQGEVVGIIGPNGSGKTTFFNILSGIYRPTKGTLVFKDRNISSLPPYRIRDLGISRTFQSSRLYWEQSVLDNVLIGLYSKQKSGLFGAIFNSRSANTELSEGVARSLEFLGYFNEDLVRLRYERVKNIPHIDRRRIEICRALVSEPDLLLLDEPTAGLNPEETMEMMSDITKIRERQKNTSIIIIEHDMAVISGVTERVCVFNAGRKITEGTFGEISKNPEVIKAYLGGEAEAC